MLPNYSGIFDAHCHLDAAAPDGMRDGPALAGRMLCGVGPGEWGRLRDVAAAWPGTVAAYGLHPWHIADAGDGWLEELEAHLLADPAAWLGEAGLDGLKTEAAGMERQIDLFSRQLDLAARLGRRVNLHCVKAWDELLACLDRRRPPGFVVHAFGGPHQFITPLAERGAWFTVGPLAWRNKSERAARRAAALPADRVLVESDAFLIPGADDVAGVAATVDWLAGVWKTGVAEAANRVRDNTRRMRDDG